MQILLLETEPETYWFKKYKSKKEVVNFFFVVDRCLSVMATITGNWGTIPAKQKINMGTQKNSWNLLKPVRQKLIP